jgi:hypothetical protein
MKSEDAGDADVRSRVHERVSRNGEWEFISQLALWECLATRRDDATTLLIAKLYFVLLPRDTSTFKKL